MRLMLDKLSIAIRFADAYQRQSRLIDDTCRPRQQDYRRLLEPAWAEAQRIDGRCGSNWRSPSKTAAPAWGRFATVSPALSRVFGPGFAIATLVAITWVIVAAQVSLKAGSPGEPTRIDAAATEITLPVQRWTDYTVVFEWRVEGDGG